MVLIFRIFFGKERKERKEKKRKEKKRKEKRNLKLTIQHL